jgi:hypothetical protein
MTEVLVKKSVNPKKKLDIFIMDKKNNKLKVLQIGDSNYSDFTKHKSEARKQHYIERHKNKEDWTYGGRFEKGFWSRYLLWEKPTLDSSIDYLNEKYKNMKIKKKD